ncbi:bacteriophage protein gp37 [Methylobacterium aquaticum]|uniref:Bacteriophage protein gp37 n=2 Tax=Methylobacterium aquaticum TaxID=270351 RepID=A0A0C6FP12_9HYPH|nr:bacteriophage protein gp37 [Methylobacterium aquaticum]
MIAMAENSTIEWTHHTWSPWIGCQKVSPACDGCYAEHLMDTRMGRVEWGPHGERSRTSAAYWRQPLAWNRAAAAAGRVERVFPSLCDPFDNRVEPTWRRDFFDLIRATPNLMWLLLSKRVQNAVDMCEAAGGLPENAAIGGTAEDQENANRVVRHLKHARAYLDPAFIFLSMEPLLEGVCLLQADAIRWHPGGTYDDGGQPGYDEPSPDRHECVDWVITGGETDQGKHKARPSHPDWFRQIRDACAAAGVPYLHKQNGEWVDADSLPSEALEDYDIRGLTADGVARVGKKHSGRLLDGVEHNGFPEVSHG